MSSYAPTSVAPDEEVDGSYTLLEKTLRRICRHECMIIMDDFNAKIEQTTDIRIRNIIGVHGIGVRNGRDEKLPQSYIDNDLIIANIYTIYIDCTLRMIHEKSGQLRVRAESLEKLHKNIKTLPSAHCGSDHRTLYFAFHIKLRTAKRPETKWKFPAIVDSYAFADSYA